MRLQIHEEVQDLRLNRYIQRGRRLIGDDDFRIEHHGACERDALALPAGEHMRIARGMLGTQADLLHHGDHAFVFFGFGQRGVDGQRLGELVGDGLTRIERGVGVLEHHLNLGAQRF